MQEVGEGREDDHMQEQQSLRSGSTAAGAAVTSSAGSRPSQQSMASLGKGKAGAGKPRKRFGL